MRYTFTEEEYEWHQRHNKLGINCWGTRAGIGIIAINRVLKREDLRVGEPWATAETYPKMSFEEKALFCLSIDQRLHAILEKLYAERM